ncbi:MAG: sigma-70 family RNA polymerase sigma factor [bacterium]|nr:sigma-70 family RNA polymerase sigma factor [bacterium]
METARTCSAATGRNHLSGLIRRVASGDDRAFSELHALTIRKMRKTALSVNSASADIEDVLQDAYLKIWRHASRFDPERASPISWMTTIVRNTAIDAVRPVRISTTDLEHAASIADTAGQADDDFDYGRAGPIAAEIIGRLPDDRRTLLSLAYLEGESRLALAERFDVPVSTIKTWLRRTLESVRTDCLLAQPREALVTA